MQIKSLPKYPGGREPEISDYQIITPLFGGLPLQISDYNFTNIYAWRKAYEYKIAELRGAVITYGIYNGNDFFLSPIGDPDKVVNAALTAITTPGERGNVPYLAAAPRWLVDRMKEIKNVQVAPDRGDWDYVHKSADLAELPGQKYHSKKNLIRQFTAKYDAKIEALNTQTCAEAMEFSDRWCEQRDCESDEGLEKEKCAIYQMLTNFEALGLHGIMVRVDGEIVALTIGEELDADTYVVHVEKGDHNMRGIYQFINRELARTVAPKHKWINREEDLDIPGLRRAKTSYHPDHFIEKFRADFIPC